MALQSPFVLWDIGFELSFAATLALIVPVRDARELILFATESLWVTIAATLATLPIIVYDFHRLSLISIPVNLLVLPAHHGLPEPHYILHAYFR